MGISITEKRLRQRLAMRRKALAANSKDEFNALTRIGNLISSQAKLNITRQRLIDTGNLRARTGYEVVRQNGRLVLRVGVFGVPYAAIHEFGFQGPITVKSHVRVITQAFGRPIESTPVLVGQHQRNINVRARPYLRPAVIETREKVLEILRDAFG